MQGNEQEDIRPLHVVELKRPTEWKYVCTDTVKELAHSPQYSHYIAEHMKLPL